MSINFRLIHMLSEAGFRGETGVAAYESLEKIMEKQPTQTYATPEQKLGARGRYKKYRKPEFPLTGASRFKDIY